MKRRIHKAKALLTSALILSAILFTAPFTVYAENADESGTTGDCTWSFNAQTGELSVTGSGAMADYQSSSKTPWYSYRDRITGISIANGVTHIGKYAFYNTSITSLTTPASVTSIGANAFYGSRRLQTAAVNGTDCVIGQSAFQYAGSQVNALDVNMTGISQIGNDCFLDSHLRSISFGEGFEAISAGAFRGCHVLERVDLPNTLAAIGQNAFWDTSLDFIVIPDSTYSIGNYAFGYDKVGTDKVLREGFIVFAGANTAARSFAITNGITHSPLSSTAGGCGWSFAPYDGILTVSGNGAVPDYLNVSDAPWQIFGGMVTDIEIENGVTAIGANAFASCGNLTRASIPGSVTAIGSHSIGYNEGGDKIDPFVICGTAQTYANTYAVSNGFAFIDEALANDVSLNGSEDINDVTLIQRYLATFETLSPPQLERADVDGNGTVDISDATKLQKLLAHVID